MKGLRVLVLATYLAFSAAEQTGQATLNAKLDVRVRLAQPGDARAMAIVLLDAFAQNPYIQYLYQHANAENREITIRCATDSIAEGLAHENAFGHIGLVRTGAGEEVVSTAAWITPSVAESSISFLLGEGSDCPGPAVNLSRAENFTRQLESAEQRVLDDVYGEHQLYLAAIGTLPRYQGHDIAGELLRGGLKHGLAKVPDSIGSLYATLAATPAGEPLYFENGYSSIENVSIASNEGDQHWRFDFMKRLMRAS